MNRLERDSFRMKKLIEAWPSGDYVPSEESQLPGGECDKILNVSS